MKIFKSNFIFYLFLICNSSIFALRADENEVYPDQRPYLFFGLSLGPSWLEPAINIKESYKKGYQLTTKVLYSKANNNFVFDFGPGFFYTYLAGTSELSSLPYSEVNVKTNWFLLEGSVRYALSKHWQIGPVVNTMLGADVGFDEFTTGNGIKVSAHAGIRFVYEFSAFKGLMRAGAQYLTDFTISNRQLHVAQIDIQYGIPLTKEIPVQEKPVLKKEITKPKMVEKVGVNNIKIMLSEGILRFDTAKSTLKDGTESILQKISETLMKHSNDWKIVRVEGHSDIRGKLEMNDRLSARRAAAVGKKLSDYGTPKKRIQSKGFGPRVPIDPENNETAWQLNRRVEILLDGVTNTDDLVKELLEIK